MVMLDLFVQSGREIGVAHVNHSTRDGASDKDALFVKAYCQSKSIPYHEKILQYHELSQGNFQQNARAARYKFFYELCVEEGYTQIATAHHQDDRWETFLMNLNRKSGLNGLSSIAQQDGMLIRPLLRYSRKHIEMYAAEHQIDYREDLSNASDDYLRNRIRHHITPVVTEVFPDMIQHASASMDHMAASQKLITELISQLGLAKKKDNRSLWIFSWRHQGYA